MLTLTNLKRIRQGRGLMPEAMAKITEISHDRYRALELHSRGIAEPFFDEAMAIARVLNVPILMLIRPNDEVTKMTEMFFGHAMPIDRDHWRSGARISLTAACRVSILFGLDDPGHLVYPPADLVTQIWSMLAVGERTPSLRTCPWCDAATQDGEAHTPTCLPNNLWAKRSREMAPNVTYIPVPRRKGGAFGVAGLAPGLKALRDLKGLTQKQMGPIAGLKSDHYARIERCELKLTTEKAQVFADTLGVHMSTIYAKPAPPRPIDTR